jgi:hypothetical protein
MIASRGALPTVPVEVLRDAVTREVLRTSLRRAAREITLSPNGLRNFINGAAARPATCLKLERWIAGRDTRQRAPSLGQFVKLVNGLSGDLTPRQAKALGYEVAALLVAGYEARQLTPPRWASELAHHATLRQLRLRSSA